MSVFIRALSVEEVGGGVYKIEVPERELTQQERATLTGLFPNLTERAYQLLSQEALLEAIATDSDVNAAMSCETRANGGGVRKAKKVAPLQSDMPY